MRYLTDYTEEATTKLLKQTGSFFAFSDKQFDEAKKENIKYVHLFGGLITPKQSAKIVLSGIEKIGKNGIKQDIKENGIDGIIKRELSNHEAYYTGDITSTIEALNGYEITAEQIRNIYNLNKHNN
jgi:hypothetical protein